jgi:two-component system chemotaxis response regulator CheB
VAVDGEAMKPGVIYFAPDDAHLAVHPGGVLRTTDDPPIRGHRPSGNVLFRSMADSHRWASY